MLSLINKAVKLDFYPISIEVQFQKSLKFQIAIFTNSPDQKGKRVLKIEKTQPMKFSNPQVRIALSNTLSLLTTITYDTQLKRYQNKQIEFEMALEVDGRKHRLPKKINVKEAIQSKEKVGKFMMQDPAVVLFYKVDVKFQEQGKADNRTNQNAKKKILHFDEFSKQKDLKVEDQVTNKGSFKIDRENELNKIAVDKSRQIVQRTNQQAKNKEQKLVKSKSLNANHVNSTSNNINNKSQKSSIEGKIIMQSSEDKLKNLNQVKSSLESENKQFQNKLKEKDNKIAELLRYIEETNKHNEASVNSGRSAKEIFKKERIYQQKQITELKDQLKDYKKEVLNLSKTVIIYQQSSKNIATGSEAEIKSLKDRIRQLQKNEQQNNKQIQKYFSQLKDKQYIIANLKDKILLLEKDNLEQRQEIKEYLKKIEVLKQQHQIEVQELKENIKQLKDKNISLKLPSCREFKEDPFDLKRKIEVLEKQIERKEELLQKMTQIKKNNQQDISNENSTLKKEVTLLKQMIDTLESKRKQELSSTTSLQHRVQMQKMKKQLSISKKNEKTLLIQKGRLQTSGKQFQEDVVKGKQAIVNILNLIQETGNQQLISEAYSLIQ